MERLRLLHKAQRGQALLGALIVVVILGVLTASLTTLAIEGQQAGTVARDQLTAQSIAETGINAGLATVQATSQNAFTNNLFTVTKSYAQTWVTGVGSPCSASSVAYNIGDMFYHYFPFTPSAGQPIINTIQRSSPPASGNWIRLWDAVAGPGGQTYTWEVQAGIEGVGSPCPTWNDNGSQTIMMYPIGAYAFAWVWGPQGQVLGEMTEYTPSATPGYVVMTYTDCPAYYQPSTCNYPTAVQVAIPAGELLWDDPNVSTPTEP
ncbi:MAG TPA: hypothetical protein VKZ50_04040 [bacterium]|nr:hypothetical protein [bacterium]